MRRLNSHGVANPEQEEVLAQLREKYPESLRPLPDKKKADPIPSLGGLRQSLIKLKAGVSPGCGGLRQEYLSLLGLKLKDEGMARTEEFGMRYLQGDLPPWFYTCWLTVQCVPLFKTGPHDTVRPLGIRNPLLKAFHREVSQNNRDLVKEFVEPQQLVLTQGGGSILVFSVQGVVEKIMQGSEYDDWVAYKIDMRNAYNEMYRAETIKVMQEQPTLQHLATYSAVTLSPYSGLECGGRLWGRTIEGGTQGDPKTGDDFATTLQPSLLLLDAACGEGGGLARAGADDVIVLGPQGVVTVAVLAFAAEVRAHCGLEVQWGKTELYSLSPDLPPGSPDGLTKAGRMIGDRFIRVFMCWGVPVG